MARKTKDRRNLHRPSGKKPLTGRLEGRVAQRTDELRVEIAERDRAEAEVLEKIQELINVYRVHTAGALAASVAHELNQPLAAIASYLEASLQAVRAGKPPDTLAKDLELTLAQTQRAADVVRELRYFLAQETSGTGPTDLNEIAKAVKQLVSIVAEAAGVAVELDLKEPLKACMAARVPIEHVLLNLAKNAIEAIRGAKLSGGSVRIITRQANGDVEVTVADNGPGLEADSVNRAFDAFSSAKPHGLGMGLSICRSIVSSYGGRIWVDPPGAARGAVFHFTLPEAK